MESEPYLANQLLASRLELGATVLIVLSLVLGLIGGMGTLAGILFGVGLVAFFAGRAMR